MIDWPKLSCSLQIAKIGTVAYKLELPSSTKLHLVFHVACLKPFHDSSVSIEPSLPVLTQGELQPLSKAILDSRCVHNTNQVLVYWDGLSPTDSSLEEVSSYSSRFPSFALAAKCHFNGGGNVMNNFHVDKQLANVDKKSAKGKCIRDVVDAAAED
uniref:Tf2-1-like SH3-like domain-containing protein n=1 Tax=Populus alba TaxID=43335 RepID=A0A4U5QYW2_POPAL|nr:hypothetical protein D5086_0000022770 [Populus alba]